MRYAFDEKDITQGINVKIINTNIILNGDIQVRSWWIFSKYYNILLAYQWNIATHIDFYGHLQPMIFYEIGAREPNNTFELFNFIILPRPFWWKIP